MSDFTLRWEDIDGSHALLHCEVQRWVPSVAKELDLAVGRLFEDLLAEGYTEAFTLSANSKFCAYMGGVPIGIITYEDIDHWVYKWELE